MLWFILVGVLLYGAMQFLVLLELRRAFPRQGAWRLAPVVLLILMNGALALARLLRGGDETGPAAVAAFIGRWWVTASIWLLLVAAIGELWNLGVRAAGRKRLAIPPRWLMGAAGVMILGLSAWGLIEARTIHLETVVIRTPRRPAGSKTVRVVQICDLHLTLLMSREVFARILARVREAKPDLLVFTGDFADEASPYVRGLAAKLAEIDAPLGKLAALGNHEYYLGIDRSGDLLRHAGFRLLRVASVGVGGHLIVAGADDLAAEGLGRGTLLDETLALPPRSHAEFVILLKHQPWVDDRSLGRFDLQLSGHTHGGQVFPGGWMIRPFYRHIRGRYDLPGGATLYVSRGAGTFGPPMRVLSPPEVTLILIEPAVEPR